MYLSAQDVQQETHQKNDYKVSGAENSDTVEVQKSKHEQVI